MAGWWVNIRAVEDFYSRTRRRYWDDKVSMMKNISIAEFEALVARDDWRHKQEFEIFNEENREIVIEDWNDETESNLISVPHAWGFASKVSSIGDIKITYSEGFSYDKFQLDSLIYGTEGLDEVWFAEGVSVVDEDGAEINAHDLADYLSDDFSSIDYDQLEIERIIEIDVDEDSDMETFTLEIDNAPSIRFTGELIASASSSDNKAIGSSYSGQTGRWTELALYKTKGGRFVCHQVGRTRWINERDRFSGKVCEEQKDVNQFFGHRWLAKELYEEAGIEDVVVVE